MTGAGPAGALRSVVELLLPARCLACGDRLVPTSVEPEAYGSDRLVCGACLSRLVPAPWPRCPRCHRPRGTGREDEPDCLDCRSWPTSLQAARAAVLLEPPADALVHGLKYEGWRNLAVPMADRMAATPLPPLQRPVVLPVPTSPGRARRRGYNQAALLAHAVAGRLGLPCRDDVLARPGRQGSQIRLSPDARRRNVEGAFHVLAVDRIRGRPVLLVDDVLTTGATAASAARVLERAGAIGVVVLTFARALPRAPADRPETASHQES